MSVTKINADVLDLTDAYAFTGSFSPKSGWEFVSRTTCSSTADVSYTDLTTGYDYQVVVTNLLFGTDSQRVTAVVGVAGPTYRTSGYLAMSTYVSSASNAGGQKDTTSFNPMSTSATSDANGESFYFYFN